MKIGERNLKHPELQVGEIFLINVGTNDDHGIEIGVRGHSGFHAIGWKTKRLGSVAYDISGNPLNHMCPVFVQKAEIDKAGIKINNKP